MLVVCFVLSITAAAVSATATEGDAITTGDSTAQTGKVYADQSSTATSGDATATGDSTALTGKGYATGDSTATTGAATATTGFNSNNSRCNRNR